MRNASNHSGSVRGGNRSGKIFITIGVVLILAALLLLVYNEYQDYRAGQQAELLMGELQTVMAGERGGHEVDLSTLDLEMPEVKIDGYGYIGYVTIPSLELELPVMGEWDYYRLSVAPCRHFGSARTDDLVIAAHNFKKHFGLLSKLEPGAAVIFTDMDQIEYHYELADILTKSPDAVDDVLNSDYDLVLYTCTPGGATRVVAYFERVAVYQGEA